MAGDALNFKLGPTGEGGVDAARAVLVSRSPFSGYFQHSARVEDT